MEEIKKNFFEQIKMLKNEMSMLYKDNKKYFKRASYNSMGLEFDAKALSQEFCENLYSLVLENTKTLEDEKICFVGSSIFEAVNERFKDNFVKERLQQITDELIDEVYKFYEKKEKEDAA